MKHYRIHVTGRVQGVGFRYAARRMANKYSLAGFVRNQPDGSVYIEAEGPEEQVELFLSWCRRGPEMSYVTGLEVTEGQLKNHSGFGVRF